MIAYDVLVTSVRDRADLLERTLRSMHEHLTQRPARVLVHEDHRPGIVTEAHEPTLTMLDRLEREYSTPHVLFERDPGAGLGRAILRLLEAAETDLVFYSQEDFDYLRPIPVAQALAIAQAHALNLVRFNKQKTEWCKGQDRPPAERWTAEEVTFDGQTFVINDRWCHQPSLWRRSVALAGYRAICGAVTGAVNRCEDRFDQWLNRTLGGGCGCVDGDQQARRERCRTFIWGKIREQPFVRHTGGERRSQGWVR